MLTKPRNRPNNAETKMMMAEDQIDHRGSFLITVNCSRSCTNAFMSCRDIGNQGCDRTNADNADFSRHLRFKLIGSFRLGTGPTLTRCSEL